MLAIQVRRSLLQYWSGHEASAIIAARGALTRRSADCGCLYWTIDIEWLLIGDGSCLNRAHGPCAMPMRHGNWHMAAAMAISTL